jgi:ribulose-phosphate 3-epimerase
MIVEPEKYVDDFAKAGADLIGVHAEACVHLHRVIQQIRHAGKRPSVTLNPATPIDHVRHVLPDVDQVLLMSVNPGFGGQAFIPEVLQKAAALRVEIDRRGLSVDIEIDGGIKPDNIAEAARAGVDVFVAGSAIFEQKDYAQVIRALRSQAEAAR